MHPLLSNNEEQRLEVLQRYQILDSDLEAPFDDLAQLAATICGTPIALVSLLDRHRQWFSANVGLSSRETLREFAFGAHALHEAAPLVVPDAQLDPRFSRNPLVTGEPHIRFYAGVPIRTETGHVLGTLCVMDQEPRHLSKEQVQSLEILARQVMAQMEFRMNAQLLQEQGLRLRESGKPVGQSLMPPGDAGDVLDLAQEAILVRGLDGRIGYWSAGARQLYGWTSEEAMGSISHELLHTRFPAPLEQINSELLQKGRWEGELVHTGRAGRVTRVESRWTLSREKVGAPPVVLAIDVDVTDQRQVEQRMAAQHALTTVLANPDSAVDVVPEVLSALGETLGWELGNWWTWDAPAGCLRQSHTWRSPRLTPIASGPLDQPPVLSPGVGVPGRVWQTGQSEWIENLANHPSTGSDANPQKSCVWAFSVVADNRVFAVAEFLQGEPKPVNEGLLAAARSWGIQIGQCLERRQMHTELRTTTALQRGILDSAVFAIFSTDNAGRFASVNRAAQQMLGYTAEELIAKECPLIFHDPEEVLEVTEELSKELGLPLAPGRATFVTLAERGLPFEREWTFIRKDGSRFPVQLSITGMRDSDGQLIGVVAIAKDITERRRATSEALEARSHLQDLFDNVSNLIQSIDIEGRFLFVNRAWRETLGYSEAELENLTIMEIVHPDSREHFQESCRRIMDGESLPTIEATFIAKNGTRVEVEGNITCRVQDGRPVATRGIFRELTDRKAAEAALRESETTLRSFYQSAPLMMGIVEVVGEQLTQVSGNPAVAAFLSGYPGTGTGLLSADLCTPEEVRCRWLEACQAARSTGTPARLEYEWKTSSGARWLRASVSHIATRVDRDRYSYVVEDFTDRKIAEDVVLREQMQLRQIIATAPVAMAMFDREMRFLTCSDRWRADYRLGDVDLVGRCVYEIFPEIRAEWRELVERALAGEALSSPEDRFERADGTLHFLRWAIQPWRTPDGAVGGVVMVTDIIDELVHAREAALAASTAKSEFLASMSHEIRTPMNAIIGMSDLLADTPLEVTQTEYVRILRRAGETLLTLIDDILDLSRIEAGHLELEELEFDLGEVLDRASDVTALRAHQKGLELLTQLGQDVPARVAGDPHRLRQVLLNLLGNAIKFTERGEVVLRVNRDVDDPAGMLCFSVTDTGIGIPPELQQEIFQTFTQADSSTTRRFGGSGLGLAISRKLVERMGGTLQVRSEPGEGSTFFFTWPLRPVTSEGRVGTAAQTLEGKRILVVDDNVTNRLILREMLAAWGCSTSEAPSGEGVVEAMRAAKQRGEPFDLLLLDAQMPHLDGFQVAERIRSHRDLASATIMMLTSGNRAGELTRVRDLGLDAYLIKPIKRDDLFAAIQSAVGAAAARSQSATPSAPAQAAAGETGRLLLVEDSPDNRALVLAYLRRTSYHVDVAENGEEAVRKFTTGRYGLVLMDIQMPVMDGYAATAAIREWEHAVGVEPTPIVALTAHAFSEDVERSHKAGCSAHLVKPIKKTTLLETITTYLGPGEDARPN